MASETLQQRVDMVLDCSQTYAIKTSVLMTLIAELNAENNALKQQVTLAGSVIDNLIEAGEAEMNYCVRVMTDANGIQHWAGLPETIKAAQATLLTLLKIRPCLNIPQSDEARLTDED